MILGNNNQVSCPWVLTSGVSVRFICYSSFLLEEKTNNHGRLNRVSPVGVSQHIIQRGTNRQAIFAGESDMRAYWGGLKNILLNLT